jgi:hypothetical protein
VPALRFVNQGGQPSAGIGDRHFAHASIVPEDVRCEQLCSYSPVMYVFGHDGYYVTS